MNFEIENHKLRNYYIIIIFNSLILLLQYNLSEERKFM